MYVIIRDPVTNADVKVDSLTGFVKGEPVEKVSPGLPLSETPSLVSVAKHLASRQHFVLGLDEPSV
jgi:hypothetical protein